MVYSDELYHYGVKGMRWGHRKDTIDGRRITKHRLKKAIKNRNYSEHNKVNLKYQREFKNNKVYNDLGIESTNIAKRLSSIEEKHADNINWNPRSNKEYMRLSKRHNELDRKMSEIEVSVGKKYISAFNEAKLKDIKYSGGIEEGRKMLEKYDRNYLVRKDGYITVGKNFHFYDGGVYPENDYIRPRNM